MSNLCYVSSQLGLTYEVDGPDMYTQMAHAIRKNQWDYSLSDNAATAIKRKAWKASCDFHFTDADVFNEAMQAFDADMQAGVPGVLVADGLWTQSAFIAGWSADERYDNGLSGKATVLLLDGVWRRVTRVTLESCTSETTTIGGLDLDDPNGTFELDTDFDLGVEQYGVFVPVDNVGGALLRIRFHGPCMNPYISLAGNTYKVNAAAGYNEYIIIDPLGRNSGKLGEIVYRINQYNITTNLYSSRERGYEGSGSYVFERLPHGEHSVTWPQDITVDIDVIDERGMPPWSL